MDDKWNNYFIEGTDVLKNKLGITDQELLKQKENEIVLYKLSYLILNGMEGNFDAKHLCDIHRFLFSDIYYFAGNYRDVEIFKRTAFTKPDEISNKLDKVIFETNMKEINANNKFDIAKYLADYHNKLIDIHPFREGNGRAIREFIRQFVLYKFPDYELDYSKINKKHFLDAVDDPYTFSSLIAYEFYNALTLKDVKKI